ncbi:MAG: glycosyltransferase family 39 protein [Anaerolineae bacterium]
MYKVHSLFTEHALAGLVVAIFGLVVLFVNPLRETAMKDDWAYAWTVRHLLETGKYQLHEWAAPNLIFQAYWGGLFARLLGYSFSSLRISTLVLLLVALLAFYNLAREHGLDNTQAGLLMFGLLASPLVLHLSFTFNADVPFLACLIIALYFYTRAIRLHSYSLMFIASIAASAAILTRQFGVVLIGGLFFLWVLSRTRQQKRLFSS